MNRSEIEERASKLKWFQCIDLPCDDGGVYTTPGQLDASHCSEGAATQRFGIPHSLEGKSVLDIGSNDGYFSFLAEKRGAMEVFAIDVNQGDGDNVRCFNLAKEALNSRVNFMEGDILETAVAVRWDVVFFFGVLYHTDNPIGMLRKVFDLTREVALIETAVSPDFVFKGQPIPSWQYLPGHEGDPTNKWYPSLRGLEVALLDVGFASVEIIHVMDGGFRATVRAMR